MIGRTLADLRGRGASSARREPTRTAVEVLLHAVQREGEASVEPAQRNQKEQWFYIQAKRVRIGQKDQVISVEIDVTVRAAEAELDRARARRPRTLRAPARVLGHATK